MAAGGTIRLGNPTRSREIQADDRRDVNVIFFSTFGSCIVPAVEARFPGNQLLGRYRAVGDGRPCAAIGYVRVNDACHAKEASSPDMRVRIIRPSRQ